MIEGHNIVATHIHSYCRKRTTKVITIVITVGRVVPNNIVDNAVATLARNSRIPGRGE